jgi:RNase P/RNase MRP subunit POP5
MSEGASFVVHAGERALTHVRANGITPRDIACIPAAAGGPKGLALIPLDKLLLGDWLRGVEHIELIGASIGAWRMAAAAMADPVAALDRLVDGYVAQTYPRKPTTKYVSDECRKLARAVLGGTRTIRTRPGVGLSIFTTRARGVLQANRSKVAFARAAFANTLSRTKLAAHMERVVFHSESALFPKQAPDAFGLTRVALNERNAEDALLASGSIPLVCDPVPNIEGAPRGDYWDGGLIDYHLLLPYRELAGLVLYPHFAPQVTAGWLDKFLPWRKHARAHPWLGNLLLISPSPALLARLPNRKLPDRNDFYRYGLDHASRMRDWKRAITECKRFADEVMAWLARPDPSIINPL